MNQPAPPLDARALLAGVRAAVREAGEAILAVYHSDFAVQRKDDRSLLTEADLAAEAILTPALRALLPGAPVVAEEAAARGEAGVPAAGAPFWLVDPLDGTREFVARNGEFTVNVALVVDGRPWLGVVAAPAQGREWFGVVGHGAWAADAQGERAIAARRLPAQGPTLACSRSHGDEAALARWLGSQPGQSAPVARIAAGSALKFGLLAEGLADLYPRLGRTMEWDTAAGEALLVAAGGRVTDLLGAPLRYGKPGFESPHFVARGRA